MDRNLYLGYGSIVNNQWKLVRARSGNEKMMETTDMLFEITKDPFETNNVLEMYPEVYKRMVKLVSGFDSIKSENAVPPYAEGRKGFKAPKEWKIAD